MNARHRVVVATTVEIPVGRGRRFGANMPRALDLVLGGWQVSGTYTHRSGQFLRFGAMIAPDNVKQIGDVGKSGYWFDTGGFSVLPAYTRRTNPWQYDDLTGPSSANLDAVLARRFDLHKDTKLEFRVEAYNALNGIAWANPTVAIASSDFGRTIALASGNAGRRLPVAFRLVF